MARRGGGSTSMTRRMRSPAAPGRCASAFDCGAAATGVCEVCALGLRAAAAAFCCEAVLSALLAGCCGVAVCAARPGAGARSMTMERKVFSIPFDLCCA
jgi:hypothetical protein